MNRPDPNATQAHWDHLAGTYDQAKARNDVYYGTLKACFDAAVPRSHRARVLEVGCGTGQILASLSPADGVGIDLSPEMIRVARQQFANRPELRFEATDGAGAARFGPFDAVISADVLEHVEHWQAVVESMVHACKPGGIVAISTPNPRWTAPLWVLENMKLKMPEGPHCFVSAKEIARLLEGRGATLRDAGTHLLIPARLGGLGPAVSHLATRLPVLKGMGVIQLVSAVKN